jgi:K+-transporting ATPase ATPase A chain
MSAAGIIQAAALLAILTALTPPLGRYMAWVFRRPPRGLERRLLGVLRVDLTEEQDWKSYARSMLIFSALCFVALYVLLRTQGLHPLIQRASTRAPGTCPSTRRRRSSATPAGAERSAAV